jgi:hypothetical protein
LGDYTYSPVRVGRALKKRRVGDLMRLKEGIDALTPERLGIGTLDSVHVDVSDDAFQGFVHLLPLRIEGRSNVRL